MTAQQPPLPAAFGRLSLLGDMGRLGGYSRSSFSFRNRPIFPRLGTIKQFISKTNKVYFYFKNTDLCKQFYQKAETEGIMFCGTNPTEKETTDLVALLPSGEICYVGWAGRMCYHNCKEGVVRIDYEKFISDEWEYIIHK